MQNRFTERAQKVIYLAQMEAQRLKHSAVGTEHLLLGILKEGEGVAANVLRSFGIDPASAASNVEMMIGIGDASIGHPSPGPS